MNSRNQREGFYCGYLKLFIIKNDKVTENTQRQHVRTGSANKLCGLKFGGKNGAAKEYQK